MISGQEPHQPDVDSEPRQEDPGGGGAQASLDLPEGEGGLCVPQVSSIIFLFWIEKYSCYISAWLTQFSFQTRDCGLLEEIQCKKEAEGGNLDHNACVKELLK